MQYIFTQGCISQLSQLNQEYHHKKHIKLDTPPPYFNWLTVFGATDLKKRRAQIQFIEKTIALFDHLIINEFKDLTENNWVANLMASRIIIAACIYIQNEIGGSKNRSMLHMLLNKNLHIDDHNFIDDDDRLTCFQTALQMIDQPLALENLNKVLLSKDKAIFTAQEINTFSKYLKSETTKIELAFPISDYPVTHFVQPVFASAFTYVGATMGWFVAEVVGNSSTLIPTKTRVASGIGSVILAIGSTGPAGVALLVPTIASRIVNNFCTVSLASLSGTAMGYIGWGAGTLCGIPFDLIYKGLKSSGSFVIKYFKSAPTPLDGIRIADDAKMIAGIPLEINLTNDETEHDAVIKVSQRGEICFENGVEESKKVSQALEQFKLYFKEKNEQQKLLEQHLEQNFNMTQSNCS